MKSTWLHSWVDNGSGMFCLISFNDFNTFLIFNFSNFFFGGNFFPLNPLPIVSKKYNISLSEFLFNKLWDTPNNNESKSSFGIFLNSSITFSFVIINWVLSFLFVCSSSCNWIFLSSGLIFGIIKSSKLNKKSLFKNWSSSKKEFIIFDNLPTSSG